MENNNNNITYYFNFSTVWIFTAGNTCEFKMRTFQLPGPSCSKGG